MIHSDFSSFILFFAALTLTVLAAEVLRRFEKLSSETSRKLVHMGVGVLAAFAPFLFQSIWPMVGLGIIFTLLVYLALRGGKLKGMHSQVRQSYGTVFFPISFTLLVLFVWNNNHVIFVTSMLIMALADAFAAIVGERSKRPVLINLGFEKKSLQGSLVMFLASFALVVLCFFSFTIPGTNQFDITAILCIAVIVAIFATSFEILSIKGSDNLTVPLGVAFVMYYMINSPFQDRLFFSIGMVLAILVAYVSFRLRFLSASGAVSVFLLGSIIFGIGGWTFSVPILMFFVLSSLLSKIGKKQKRLLASVIEKTGCRDVWQVLANGGVAGIFVLLWYFFPLDVWYILYLGALAAVTADTWGTEIGVLSKGIPRSILTFQTVSVGTSGGLSIAGTIGSAMGSLVLAGVGVLFSPHSSPRIMGVSEFFIVLFAGFAGSLIDSFLGATIQAQYRCKVCGKLTEKLTHCEGTSTEFIHGFQWINNDVVNGFAALSGVVLAALGWYFIS